MAKPAMAMASIATRCGQMSSRLWVKGRELSSTAPESYDMVMMPMERTLGFSMVVAASLKR